MPDVSEAAKRAAEEIFAKVAAVIRHSNPCSGKCESCGFVGECRNAEETMTAGLAAIIERHMPPISPGISRVLEERRKQIEAHGFDATHDDRQDAGQLAWAACYYAMPKMIRSTLDGSKIIPLEMFLATEWADEWAKRERKTRIEQVTVAAALLIAELERLMREEKNA